MPPRSQHTIRVTRGSVSASSINRRLARVLIKLAPDDLQCSFIEIDGFAL